MGQGGGGRCLGSKEGRKNGKEEGNKKDNYCNNSNNYEEVKKGKREGGEAVEGARSPMSSVIISFSVVMRPSVPVRRRSTSELRSLRSCRGWRGWRIGGSWRGESVRLPRVNREWEREEK